MLARGRKSRGDETLLCSDARAYGMAIAAAAVVGVVNLLEATGPNGLFTARKRPLPNRVFARQTSSLASSFAVQLDIFFNTRAVVSMMLAIGRAVI